LISLRSICGSFFTMCDADHFTLISDNLN
jgi:hypothetical protein